MRGKKLPRSKKERTARRDMRLFTCQPPYNSKSDRRRRRKDRGTGMYCSNRTMNGDVCC